MGKTKLKHTWQTFHSSKYGCQMKTTYLGVGFRVLLSKLWITWKTFLFQSGTSATKYVYTWGKLQRILLTAVGKSSSRRILEKPRSLAPLPHQGGRRWGGGERGGSRPRSWSVCVGPPPIIAHSKLQKKMDGWSQLVAGSSVLGLTCWVNWWWWWAGLGLRH